MYFVQFNQDVDVSLLFFVYVMKFLDDQDVMIFYWVMEKSKIGYVVVVEGNVGGEIYVMFVFDLKVEEFE